MIDNALHTPPRREPLRVRGFLEWGGAMVLAAMLAGCAAGGDGPGVQALLKPEYLRTERNLAMTFPEIQMALFRHESLCGAGPVFRMKEGETSYATIIEADSDQRLWNDTIAFELMWLQPTLRYETRTRVYVYSFHSSAQVRRRIERVFDAVTSPEVCPEASAETDENAGS